MARPVPLHRTFRRSGVVLLIVMAMLALFAVIGLSFVFYADSEAESARFRRQAETLDYFDVTPEQLFSYALGQLIFDTDNPNSKMHGHSLGRSMYSAPGGTVAFNGLGRPHPDTRQTLEGLTPFDGINVPYTYPDINNPFLACLDPDNPGYLKERSFFRNGSSLRPQSLNPLRKNEGDVRNIDSLDGTMSPTRPGLKLYNDAFWMDLDFPIMTAKDGTRFKPLFAFTVLDLDGRLNLAVSGNYKADYTKAGGTSRCGLGTFEINPARVLTIDKSEIAKLFQGSTTAPSRHGADNAPDSTVRFPWAAIYSRVDYTGLSDDTVTRAIEPYSHFPSFGDWTNMGWITNTVAVGPTVPHAVGFDYFGSRSPAKPSDDLKLAASNTEAILRWRDRGASALTSDLIRLLPNNLTPQNVSSARILDLITPYSMSIDTAHLAPFFVGDVNAGFVWNAGDPYPKCITATQVVAQSARTGAGEFSSDFRSQIAALLPRLNLNGKEVGTNTTGLQDSKRMAKDIFDRLVRVTGALPPSPGAPFQPADINDPQFKATRWLAQLAVNIVDFIDQSQIMTVFHWNPNPRPTPIDYVFGVELNRLLINEAYASVDNDPISDGTKYRVNAWAELYNPLPAGSELADFTQADLVSPTGDGPRCRLLLAKDPTGIADSPTGLPKNYFYDRNDPALGVTDWKSPFVFPGGRTFRREPARGYKDVNIGFYLVGPPDAFINARKPTWTDNGKPLKWDHNSLGMQSGLIAMPLEYQSLSGMKATLVLQRLANYFAVENNDPADTDNYNPYVTIDVFPDIPVNNSVRIFGARDDSPPAIGSFRSVGRFQPLQATNVKAQYPDAERPAAGNEPQHTFGRQNFSFLFSTLKNPFDTVYRMDRALISSAEALFAPTAPPWEFTQRFANPQLPLSAYGACQNDVNSLLFRFLETVTTGDRFYSRQLAPYSRIPVKGPEGIVGTGLHAIVVPGKINLNTVTDERVIQALFDRQSNSVFSDEDVHQFWLDLLEVRKTRPIAGFSDYTFDRNTRAVTMQNTLIGKLFKKMYDRAAKDGANEFEATEGLRKVMNNITFTSNAFAVWVTAGFFEVDAAGNPIQEIGKNENRHVRRRMFAVVDRSQLVVPAPAQKQPFTTMTGASAKGATNATLAAISGFLRSQDPSVRVDFPWQIKAGTALTIDRGQPTEETVIVQSVSGNQIQIAGAGFAQQHDAGATVDFGGIQGPQVPLNRQPDGSTAPNFMLGYPGPQAQFNLREYSYVVPHYNIID